MTHQCQCQTTTRRLGLVFGRVLARQPEVVEVIRGFGWAWHEQLSTAVAEVGPNARFRDAAEVYDLIAGILGVTEAREVGATWLEPGPIEEQAGRLLSAQPLTEFAPDQASPLASILEARAIETWFQPVVAAGDRRVVGHECLMRARNPDDGGRISPADLITWARAENLLFMLDRVCREVHIANAAADPRASHGRLLLNFVPSVIYRPEFCLRSTVQALEGTDIRPEQVVFEVVESEAVGDHDHLRDILRYYREHGFRVALDDVGAGYAGLSLMADLDPDLIKIDRELVRRSSASDWHAEVCQSIVELGRRHGKEILAEGIETEAECARIGELGVDLFQGFLFGRPRPEPVSLGAPL